MPGEPCTPQHYDRALLESHLGDVDLAFSFMIVRHPVERLVSEYCWQMRRRLVPPPFGWWLRNALARLETDRYCFDNHLRPQHEFCYPGAEVFRFEDGLGAVLTRITTLTGLEYAARLEHRKKRRHRLVRICKSELGMIEMAYQQDYEQFGYDP